MKNYPGVVICLLLVFLFAKKANSQEARPNVILIICDDMRWDSFAPNGGPSWFQTPSINRIAYEGANFKNAYCTYSLCTPSRGSIVTGLYPHCNGAVDNFSKLNPSLNTVQKILHDAGYHTGMIGKYGESTYSPLGWDYWLGITGGTNYVNPKMVYNGQNKTIAGNITQILSDSSLRYIANVDTPFFVFLGHQVPHKIIVPLPQDNGVYAGDPMPVPDNFTMYKENYPSFLYSDRSYYKDTNAVINDYEKYFEGINGVEDNVAGIFNTLTARGILDNTMIIFITDNGSCYGEHQLGGKALAYDPAIHSPLFVRYPAWFPPNTIVSNNFALNIDITPTIVSASKEDETSYGFQGVSLKKLYDGTASRNQFVAEYIRVDHQGGGDTSSTPALRMLQTSQYKYIRYRCTSQTEELFDLVNDPEENSNKFHDTAYAAVLASMRSKLDSMLIVVNDTLQADTVTISCQLVVGRKFTPLSHGNGTVFHFRLSQDPAGQFVQADFENDTEADAELFIMNELGQVLQSEKWKADQNLVTEKFDISSLSSGIYFAALKCGDHITTQTFLKN